jgi:methyl coenzyme M reductase subunit D
MFHWVNKIAAKHREKLQVVMNLKLHFGKIVVLILEEENKVDDIRKNLKKTSNGIFLFADLLDKFFNKISFVFLS